MVLERSWDPSWKFVTKKLGDFIKATDDAVLLGIFSARDNLEYPGYA